MPFKNQLRMKAKGLTLKLMCLLHVVTFGGRIPKHWVSWSSLTAQLPVPFHTPQSLSHSEISVPVECAYSSVARKSGSQIQQGSCL